MSSEVRRGPRAVDAVRSESTLRAMFAGFLMVMLLVATPAFAQTYPPPPAPDQDTVLDGVQPTPPPPTATRPPAGGAGQEPAAPEGPATGEVTPPPGPLDSPPPAGPDPSVTPPPLVDDAAAVGGLPWGWILAGVVAGSLALLFLLGRRRSGDEDGSGASA
jgi:hypothetical protein